MFKTADRSLILDRAWDPKTKIRSFFCFVADFDIADFVFACKRIQIVPTKSNFFLLSEKVNITVKTSRILC
jgi:hypothetical protein